MTAPTKIVPMFRSQPRLYVYSPNAYLQAQSERLAAMQLPKDRMIHARVMPDGSALVFEFVKYQEQKEGAPVAYTVLSGTALPTQHMSLYENNIVTGISRDQIVGDHAEMMLYNIFYTHFVAPYCRGVSDTLPVQRLREVFPEYAEYCRVEYEQWERERAVAQALQQQAEGATPVESAVTDSTAGDDVADRVEDAPSESVAAVPSEAVPAEDVPALLPEA